MTCLGGCFHAPIMSPDQTTKYYQTISITITSSHSRFPMFNVQWSAFMFLLNVSFSCFILSPLPSSVRPFFPLLKDRGEIYTFLYPLSVPIHTHKPERVVIKIRILLFEQNISVTLSPRLLYLFFLLSPFTVIEKSRYSFLFPCLPHPFRRPCPCPLCTLF